MTRKVTQYIDADTYQNVVEQTGYEAYYKAIGYLSSWSLGSDNYPEVALYACGDGELYAHYIRPDNTVGYVLGAVWHPDERRYSFHS
jgi:hypothetical protein